MSWGILFVVPLTELAEDGVPEELTSGLAEATVELAKLQCGQLDHKIFMYSM